MLGFLVTTVCLFGTMMGLLGTMHKTLWIQLPGPFGFKLLALFYNLYKNKHTAKLQRTDPAKSFLPPIFNTLNPCIRSKKKSFVSVLVDLKFWVGKK